MPKYRNIKQNQCIGANLRAMRQQADMTLEEIGELLGVSYQQVQRYEAGETALPLQALPVLADRFGISADAFFDDSATFPGGVMDEGDIFSLCMTIVAVQDPALRGKIRRVVEVLAA